MKKSLHVRSPTFHLYVDSSGESWGAVLGSSEVKSVFSESQKNLHINTKELLAVLYGISSHLHILRSSSFVLYSDNTMVVSTLKKKSSSDKLRDRITARIFSLIFDHNMEMHISWIASAQNPSDKLSRTAVKNYFTEWSCSPDTVHFIKNIPGFCANIDLFASHLNNILPKFCSWKLLPGSFMTDCFNLDWSKYIGFLHSPPRLTGRCLKHINENKVKLVQGIFIVRPSANWWVPLMLHVKSAPVLLPKDTVKKLFLPWDRSI